MTPAVVLAAGPLTATVDGLSLRWLRWHDVELLRGVAFVLRDEGWGTYAPVVTVDYADEATIELRGDLPHVAVTCSLKIALTATGATLEGKATAAATFTTNRTGFVVLHGESCAARPVTIEHVDGAVTHAAFPDLISPHQPFRDIRAVTHEALAGLRVRALLEGETFEMEDHRNWSDAGFKTYCRPLDLPRPYTLAAGTTVAQRVTVALSGEVAPPSTSPLPLSFGSMRPIPRQARLVSRATDAGGALPVLLADADGQTDSTPTTRYAVLIANPATLGRTLDVLAAAPAPEALLIAGASERDVSRARAALPGARIGAGTLENFAEFNRAPPPENADIGFWAVSALVHATDDASVMETLRVLTDQVRTARARHPMLALWVGPVAIGRHDAPDPRETRPLGAAFRLGHLAAWTAAGVEAVLWGTTAPLPVVAGDSARPVIHPVLAGLGGPQGCQIVNTSARDTQTKLGVHSLKVPPARLIQLPFPPSP